MPGRLGQIEYVNVLPIYHALTAGHVENDAQLITGTPAQLNERMDQGELDVSSCSSMEYARNPEKYYLIPNLSIGSCGPVQSVLLLCRKPVEELAGETILVSAQTHTSAALLRVLLQKKYKVRVNFETGRATELLEQGKRPAAILAIGDEALRLRNHEDYPVQLDMGEEWRSWTGLPFIFGVWIASRSSFQKNPENVYKATQALLAGKEWGKANMDFICDLALERCGMSRTQMESYFKGLVFDLGEQEQKGLKLFLEKLYETGQISKVPDLVFLPEQS